jgi:three-Cys-motif partner protein
MTQLIFDRVGYWSEIKLEIVRKYARAYSTILSKQKQTNPRFSHVYIDGFSGPGVHIAKSTNDLIPGSPLNALAIEPPFDEYFLIDLDGDKIGELRRRVGNHTNVHLETGNCNQILVERVFPKVRFEAYRRGLCLLDPYGLHLEWRVIQAAGQLGSLELFINFPIMDINRNALWRNPDKVPPDGLARMTAFWGDESWRTVAYRSQPTLFGDEQVKVENEAIAEAFRERLEKVARFRRVPAPLPMRNSKGAVVYYLFFASQKPVAEHIVKEIFATYRGHRG